MVEVMKRLTNMKTYLSRSGRRGGTSGRKSEPARRVWTKATSLHAEKWNHHRAKPAPLPDAPFSNHIATDARDGPARAEPAVAWVIVQIGPAKQQAEEDDEDAHAHREDHAEQSTCAAVEREARHAEEEHGRVDVHAVRPDGRAETSGVVGARRVVVVAPLMQRNAWRHDDRAQPGQEARHNHKHDQRQRLAVRHL